MTIGNGRIRTLERALRPRNGSDDGDAREVDRLLAADRHASFDRGWYEAALRLAARLQGLAPSELEHALHEGHETARQSAFIRDVSLRAMLRAGYRWGRMTADERWDTCAEEEMRLLWPEAMGVLRAAVEHALDNFALADVAPYVPGAFGYLLLRMAEWGLLTRTNDEFGAELRTYRVTDEWRRRVENDLRGMPPDAGPVAEPPRQQQRERWTRRERVPVEV